MLGIVLESIKRIVFGCGSNQDLIINSETVKEILIAIGEGKLAQNDGLVHDMVQQASSGDPERSPEILDIESFARALTSDVHAYQIENDVNKFTTTYSDLFGSIKSNPLPGCKRSIHGVSSQDQMSEACDQDREKEDYKRDKSTSEINVEATSQAQDDEFKDVDNKAYHVKHMFTAPSIDYFIDAQVSRCIAVCLWVFFLLHVLASGSLGLQDFPSIVENDLDMCPPTSHLGCDTLRVFLVWVDVIFTVTIMGGIFIMGIGSLGNRVLSENESGVTSRIAVILSLIPAIYFFVRPFTSIGTAPGDLRGEPQRQFALGMFSIYVTFLCQFSLLF